MTPWVTPLNPIPILTSPLKGEELDPREISTDQVRN
jgi:hypothetical protein